MSDSVARRVRRLGLGAAASLALGFLAYTPGAQAGPPNVRGKIVGADKLTVDVYTDAAKPESRRWSWREPSIAVAPQFRALSPVISREIAVVATAPGKNPPLPQALLVRVTGGRTNPVTVVVPPETTLLFRNDDPFAHKLTVAGQEAPIELPPGGRVEWKAPSSNGTVELRDAQYPSLHSFVITDSTVVQTVAPSADGSFQLALTPGEYSVKAFFAGRQVGKVVAASAKAAGVLDLKDFAVAEGSKSP